MKREKKEIMNNNTKEIKVFSEKLRVLLGN
jgi:hypothetical protein